MLNRRGIAAGLTCLALAGTLSGCWNGYQAQTSAQAQGGEVASADVGDISLRGLIWVRDPKAPDTAYFSGTMITTSPDELLSISAEPGGNATVSGAPIRVLPVEPARIGFNADASASVTGVPDEPSPFLNTTLTFKNAGTVTVSVLVVPGEGPYAEVVTGSKDAGASAEASASASPSESTSEGEASASPSATPSE